MTRSCIKCGVTLTLGENWQESRKVRCAYICRSCHATAGNSMRMFVNGKYIPTSHPLYKAGRYKTFDDAAFSSLTNYNTNTSGHVYAIANAAWPEWIKIGMAVDAEDRLKGYQTSSPMRDYKLIYSIYFDDRQQAEKKAHLIAAQKTKYPWSKHDNGEWFMLTSQDAIDILNEVSNNYDISWEKKT